MEIRRNSVVTIDYIVKNDEGAVIDSTEDAGPLVYLHGADNIVPGLETALEGKSIGHKFSISVEPEDAYGLHLDEMIQYVQKDLIGDPDITIGNVYKAQDEEGRPFKVTVIEMDDDTVTLDGNHDLAGVRLNFDVTIIDIRQATEEEIENGRAVTEYPVSN